MRKLFASHTGRHTGRSRRCSGWGELGTLCAAWRANPVIVATPVRRALPPGPSARSPRPDGGAR